MKFTELKLDEQLQKGIDEAGFIDCMPVQEQAIQIIIKKKDVCAQSQTGSGKTAAFLVGIFQNYLQSQTKDLTLIVAPTRELVVQITEEARLLGKHLPLKTLAIFGGMDYEKQQSALRKGVNIIVGTPGRLLDFGKSGEIDFKAIKNLVIDEADRIFDMGFYPDLQRMLRMMPPAAERLTMLFSATLTVRVLNLAWENMNHPEQISITPDKITVEKISQTLYHVEAREKTALLLGVLKKINPANALIFCNTKHRVAEIAWRLTENGYDCLYLMGDLPQKKRLKIIEKVKAGRLKFLVATDVAARGLHIDDLALVINYDLPEDYENYVHRIGRTARAGKDGKAVSIACEEFVYSLQAIENYIGMKVPVDWPDEELFVADIAANRRFIAPRSLRNGDDFRKVARNERPARTKKEKSKNKSPGSRPKEKSGYSEVRRKSGNGSVGIEGTVGNSKKKSDNIKKNRQPVRAVKASRPRRQTAIDDRLAYYRQKYGENFKIADPSRSKSEKKEAGQGIWNRFLGFFKNKKNSING